jgi:hypothetical protein
VLLVVTHTAAARTTLRNVCRSHEETVVQRFGRAALLAATEWGAFVACRLRAKHGTAVQVEQTEPFNEFRLVDEEVREAARAYERREAASTPYTKFAAGQRYPDPETMRGEEL